MKTPQKENGYTAIANEIMEALAKFKLPGSQTQCLFFILRKTYGFNKKSDRISLSQFSKGTGLNRKAVSRALNSLRDKNVIYIEKGGVKNDTILTSKYTFNKAYRSWKGGVKNDTGSVKNEQKVVSILTHTKVDIQKKEYPSTVVDFCEKFIFYIKSTKKTLAPKSKNIKENSFKTVDLLIRKDGFDLEYIKKVLKWAIKDDFWSSNVISLASLRKKSSGLTKFQKVANSYERENKSESKNQFLSGGF